MSTSARVIEAMPVGPAHRRMFWLLGAGMLVDAFDIFMQAGVLTAMLSTGFMSTAGVAHFIFSTFLGLAVGSVLTGALADRFGRRSLYQFNLLLFGIAALVTSIAPSFAFVVPLRFVMSIGLGGELVAGYAMISEMTPAHCRGRWGVTLALVVNLAQPISAFTGVLVLPAIGWRWMFVIGGIPAIAVWYFRRALPESPRWLERHGRLDEMRLVLAALWSENTSGGALPDLAPAPPPRAIAKRPWTRIFDPGLRARTLFGCAIMILTLSAQYGFLSWVPTLLLKHGASFVHSLNYAALMALGAPLGMVASLSVIDRIGRKPILAGAALAGGAIGLLYAMSLDAPPATIIAFGFLEVMFLQVCASTILAAYLPELFPTDVRGLGTGASIAAGRVAAALMPYLVLFVLTASGAQGVFVMLAAILFALAVLVVLVGPETMRKTLEAVDAEHAGEAPDAARPLTPPRAAPQRYG